MTNASGYRAGVVNTASAPAKYSHEPASLTLVSLPDSIEPVASTCVQGRIVGNNPFRRADCVPVVGKTAMYLINWDESEGILEASLGGRVSAAEAQAFADDVRETLKHIVEPGFTFLLDRSKVKSIDETAFVVIESTLKYGRLHGASCIQYVIDDEEELIGHISANLQEILEGQTTVSSPSELDYARMLAA